MIVLGADVSTKAIDLVALELDTDQARWMHVPLGDGDLLERVRRVRRSVLDVVGPDLDDTLAVGVERPAGRHGVWQVSMAVGALLQCFPPELLVTWWVPAEWRKAVGLPGNATKQELGEWSWRHWGISGGSGPELPSQDAMDAYCVAYATRGVLRTEAAA